MSKKRVLVVGSGAREHALVRALAGSRDVDEVIAAPGNAGIARDARCESIRVDDTAGIVALACREQVALAVIGPEAPLVNGLADELRNAGIATFGPGALAARLEGSKVFAKEFMRRNRVPTAAFEAFDNADDAERYVRGSSQPLVVKADGLAAGKGVVVARDAKEALEAIDAMMRRRAFGAAGERVVIEERLEGEEVSLHVLLDGAGPPVVFGAAQDHKRIGEGDTGPNTGGMGAYAPVPAFDDAVLTRALAEIVAPTVQGLARDGLSYRGVIFIGLMVHEGAARVLEYNVRFGDPECAVLFARLDSDPFALLCGAAEGDLSRANVQVSRDAVLAVVMASAGYPASPRTGDVIEGLERAAEVPGVSVLHAGTVLDANKRVKTAGGRVLAVTARSTDLDAAAARAYEAVGRIAFDGAQYRRDIGYRARKAKSA